MLSHTFIRINALSRLYYYYRTSFRVAQMLTSLYYGDNYHGLPPWAGGRAKISSPSIECAEQNAYD